MVYNSGNVSPSTRYLRTISAQRQLTVNANNIINSYFTVEIQKEISLLHGDFDKQKETIINYLKSSSYSGLSSLFDSGYDAEVGYFITQIEDHFPALIKDVEAALGVGVKAPTPEPTPQPEEPEVPEIPTSIPEPTPQLTMAQKAQAGRRASFEQKKIVRDYVDKTVRTESSNRGINYDDMYIDQKISFKRELGLDVSYKQLYAKAIGTSKIPEVKGI